MYKNLKNAKLITSQNEDSYYYDNDHEPIEQLYASSTTEQIDSSYEYKSQADKVS